MNQASAQLRTNGVLLVNNTILKAYVCAALLLLQPLTIAVATLTQGCAGVNSHTPNATDKGWLICNTIPYPDQASEMVLDAIKMAGQPDVAAMKKLSFPSDQAMNDWARKEDAENGKKNKELANKLGVTVKEKEIAGVTVRYVSPPKVAQKNKNRLFIHTHGGGYVLNGGWASVAEAIQMAHYLKITVVSIDYRMPPAHPFPAAVDDVLLVYKELIKTRDPKTMAMGGTSAGGGLSMAAIQKFKKEGLELPGAYFCGTPWTDLSKTGDSYFINEGIDRMLITYDGVLETLAKSYAGGKDLKTPLISPVYGDFSGFPPTYLVTGTRDLFLSDTTRAHRKLKIAGVVTDLNVYEGISHGEYLFFGSPENIQTFSELDAFLDRPP